MRKLINKYQLYQQVNAMKNYLVTADSVGQKVIDRKYIEFVIDETNFKSSKQMHNEKIHALNKITEIAKNIIREISKTTHGKNETSIKNDLHKIINEAKQRDLEGIAWKISDVRKLFP